MKSNTHSRPAADQTQGSTSRVSSIFKSNHFRMYSYKVVMCRKRESHDWSTCPFAHHGEHTRRRNPDLYAPIQCINFKKTSMCSNGNSCKLAHGSFEYWLHPGKYKTSLCINGINCDRDLCFFAHTKEELRKEVKLSSEDVDLDYESNVTKPVAIAPRHVFGPSTSGSTSNNDGVIAAAPTNSSTNVDPAGPIFTDWSLDSPPSVLWGSALNSWPVNFNGFSSLIREMNEGRTAAAGAECSTSSRQYSPVVTQWEEYKLWK